MITLPIEIDPATISAFCRRHHVLKLSLFGSVLRDDFGPESDVDVLVEFDPRHIPGLNYFGMQEELAALLGRNVDLNTPQCLSRYFREEVLAEALLLHAQASEKNGGKNGVGSFFRRKMELTPILSRLVPAFGSGGPEDAASDPKLKARQLVPVPSPLLAIEDEEGQR